MSNKGYVTIPVGYKRVDGEPLELNTVFSTIESAVEYATSDPTAYVGQIISVVTDKADVYAIQTDKSLKRISQLQISVAIAQSPMTIEHNLGILPNVIVVNEEGDEVECMVTHIDENKLKISWNGEMKGRIYLG